MVYQWKPVRVCVIAFSIAAYCIFQIAMLYTYKDRCMHNNLTVSNYTSEPAIHVVLIFDHNRLDNAMQAIRSTSYYCKRQIIYHLITPPHLNRIINEQLNTRSSIIYFYDNSICNMLANPLLAFSSRVIHVSAHCKLYVAYILPHSIKKVLYIDNDVTATQDISPCYFEQIEFNPSQFIAMGPDMGEICQQSPDICWPMSFETSDHKEPYQFNGGVMLLDLYKMREWHFIDKFRETIIRTARLTNFKRARWGEQDFINSFFRVYPDTLKNLPCGCNYQYVGIKRHQRCPNKQPIYLAHGWKIGTKERNNNQYCKLFYYFKYDNVNSISPPTVSLFSSNSSILVADESEYTFNYNCPHQSYKCADKKAFNYGSTFHNDTVFVLTRTAKRRSFFLDNMMSVQEQTHPFVRHLVITDDLESTRYLKELRVNYTIVPSLYHLFDINEPCIKCASDPNRGCASAPSMDRPQERQMFMSCYCETYYPMNVYINSLHNIITSNGYSGWIIYLDDDNLLIDRFTISDALAHAKNTNQVLLWKSYLQRITPSQQNWEHIVMGDIDASGFMFHSSNIKHTRWSTKRCGDYWTIASLSEVLDQVWIDKTYVIAHPLRNKLGGLGMRNDIKHKLTIIITSYDTKGLRPVWVQDIAAAYTSEQMSSLVHKVILVWNNPFDVPPEIPGLIVLRMKVNSLNNRWTQTLKHVETDAILNLDDDILLKKEAIICMMSYWLDDPDILVGPFVRSTMDNKYHLDDLINGENYSLMLPRAMLLHKRYLKLYSKIDPAIINYVDEQNAHCDDIALNLAVAYYSKKPPMRIFAPSQTILDYYKICLQKNRKETGGLATNKDRAELRNECFNWMTKMYPDDTLKFTNVIGTCGLRGIKTGLRNTSLQFYAMENPMECIWL